MHNFNRFNIPLATNIQTLAYKRIFFIGLLLLANVSFAQTFDNTIFIGTSNTDTGRCLSATVQSPDATCLRGPYTSPDGNMWSTTLGSYYGIGVSSNYGLASSTVAPGVGYNNNYAQGGSFIYDARGVNTGGYSTSNTALYKWSATQQVTSLIAGSGGSLNANTLYIYETGTNDLKSNYNLRNTPFNIGTGGALSYFSANDSHPTYVDGTNYANTSRGYSNITSGSYQTSAMAVSQLNTLASLSAQNVINMSNAGAKYIVATNVISPTYATAVAVSLGPQWTQMAVDSISYYNSQFWNTISAAGVNFIPADISSLFNYVAVNANTFGFTNHSAYSPACGTTTMAYNCTSANLASNPSSYLFADFVGHASAGLQNIEAQYVQSLLIAPSQISMMAETSIQKRKNLMNTFHQQIPLAQEQTEDFHFWWSGDTSHITMNQATGLPNSSGSPFSVSIGAGYRINEHWLFGGAVSNTTLTQGFSSGGQFDQKDYAFSSYAGFQMNQFWGNGVLTYGTSNYNSNRQFNLGIVAQNNTATSLGKNISASIEGGYYMLNNIAGVNIKHSPIIGMTLQKSTVDGFTETNPSGAPTALSFGNQTRNSNISELGYLVNFQFDMWQPFIRATWNHELANTDRNITSSLTSVTAPSYTMPAVQFGNDWGSAMMGVNVKFTPTFRAYALVSTQFSQKNQTNTSGSVGINVGF
jgi:outer membrane lipase/esterase